MPISRIHRPQLFSEVTGQEQITETLRREVETGILGHSFLFSGPRGVGKTTSARIFAKALLCENPKKGEPDNTCTACRDIQDGKCIDLIEMDAASNTGVDNVREAIIEHVRFAPAVWKRKVYVIDECHMLSGSAWNALLKTLEEPPPYAFFILATTELHKVPETIKSRCQRFEFRRIASEPLFLRLSDLAKKEGLTIDESVLRSVVSQSDGCLRDAESLLDQLASLGEKRITEDIAGLILPVSRIPQAVELVRVASARDTGAALALMRTYIEQGLDELTVIDDILAVIRSLIRSEDPEIKKSLEAGDTSERSIATLIGQFERAELTDMALMLIDRKRDMKTGVDPSLALEIAILSIAGMLLPHAEKSGVILERQPPESPPPPLKEQPKTNRDQHTAEKLGTGVQDIRKNWNRILKQIETTNPSLPFILHITHPESFENGRLVLRFKYLFHFEKIINDLKVKRLVESVIRDVMQADIILDGIVSEGSDATPSQNRDIVTKVLDTFGGQVVDG